MFKGIRLRLIYYYMVVIAVVVIMMGTFFIWFLNYFYRQTLQENLYIQARLAASLVEEMIDRNAPPAEIDTLSKDLGRELGVRLTLVDAEGVVLADSAENPEMMDNHRNRPEIIEAMELEKGIAIRYSVTLEEDMLYMAVPLGSALSNDGSRQIAVVRLALPLARINQAVSSLLLFIIGALIVSSLAAMMAAVMLSHRITGPIRKISNASREIAKGNFNPSLEVVGRDELAVLAGNITEMGQALNRQMEKVVGEKSKLETVVSSMTSGIILTDHDQNIELVNPAAEELFDLKGDTVIGTTLQKAIRYYSLHESLKAVIREGKPGVMEINLYYPRSAVLETYIIPVRGVEEKVIGILLLFHEVTHLRSLEKMRSDFVANVSHELRTPLTTVRGFTETIMHEELTREQLLDFLQVIDRETGRLSKLLDDLLDLAQIENEKGFVKKEAVDLGKLITEAVQRVEDLRQQKKAELVLDLPAENIFVEGNYEWLCQAIVNILENAIRHGVPEGRINVKLNNLGSQASVEISDSGPGIPEADLPYVFERFYRVDKARSRKSGGTGLGLSIVKHIMEAHDAEYSLESREGSGTLFRFSLPLMI